MWSVCVCTRALMCVHAYVHVCIHVCVVPTVASRGCQIPAIGGCCEPPPLLWVLGTELRSSGKQPVLSIAELSLQSKDQGLQNATVLQG